MSILNQLQAQPSGIRRTSDFKAHPVTEYGCQPTGAVKDVLSANEEFELSAKVRVTFWANQAQFPEARKLAEKVLLQRMYGDTLALLNEAKKAIFDGDRFAALEVIDTIRKNLLD